MVTGVLFFMLVLLALLLAAFIYQILTTPLTAVDAPTLIRSAAASAPAPALPVSRRRPRVGTVPAATGPAHRTSSPGASRRLQSWSAAALAIAGLAAVIIGGWLFLHIAHGACSHQAIEVCSQGFVLLTGAQLAGGAIAVAGIGSVVMAIVLALR
jgi:hypothetical protein